MKNWVTQLTIKQLTGSILGLILVFPVVANLTHLQDKIVSLKTTYSELQYASSSADQRVNQIEQISRITNHVSRNTAQNLENRIKEIEKQASSVIPAQAGIQSKGLDSGSVAGMTKDNSEMTNESTSPASSSKLQAPSPKVLGVSTSNDFITSFRQAIVDGLPSDILTLFKGGNGGSGSSGTTYVTGPTQYSIGQTSPSAINPGTIGGVTHLGAQEINTNQLTVTQSFTVNQNVPAEFAGNLSVGGNLTLSGNQTTTGDLTVNGNTTIGDTSTDTLTLNSQILSNIIPSTDNTYNLGSDTNRWKDANLSSLIIRNDNTNTAKASLNFNLTTAQLATDTASNLQLTTGSNTGLFIDTTGNIGIGTTTPINTFQVNNGATAAFVVTSASQVGIGTTTPGTPLDVVGTIRGSNGLTISSGTVSLPAGQIDNTELANSSVTITAGNGLINGGAVSLGSSTTLNIGAGTCITSNADDIAVTADCIGDTQLAYNTGQHLTTSSTPTFAGLTLTNNLGMGSNTITSGLINGQTISSTANFTGSMAIVGNVGVGTTSPDKQLSIYKASGPGGISIDLADNVNAITFRTAGVNQWYQFVKSGDFYLYDAAHSLSVMTLQTSTGNVGIGTTTPGSKLDINASDLVGATTALRINQATGVTGSGPYGIVIGDNTQDSLAYRGMRLGLDSSGNGFIQSYVSAAFKNILIAPNGGYVGIGTSTPGSKLEVAGDIRISAGSGGQIIFADGSTMGSSGLGSAAALSSATDAIVTGDSDANGSGDIILKTGSNDRLHILNNGNVGVWTPTPVTLFDVNGKLNVLSNGNVGIGTTSPTNGNFELYKSQDGATQIASTNDNAGVASRASFLASSNVVTTYLISHGSARVVTRYGITLADYSELLANAGNGLLIGTGTLVKPIIFGTNSSERMRIDSAGNVGIGTTTPNAKLQVIGGAYFGGTDGDTVNIFGTGENSGLALSSSASGYKEIQSFESEPLYINRQGNNVILNATGGNVGVGVTSPTYKLDIRSSDHTAYGASLAIAGTASDLLDIYNLDNASNFTALKFSSRNSGAAGGRIVLVDDGTASGDFAFQLRNASGINTIEKMRITSSGNVGIGTSTPGALLDVVGNQAINGNLIFNNILTERFIRSSANGGAIRLRSNNVSGTDRGIQFGFVDNSGNWLGSNLAIEDGGYVGIGTTSFTYGEKFHVAGGAVSIDNAQYFVGYNSFGNGRQLIGISASNKVTIGGNSDDVTIPGNVGLGTTTPGAPLEINRDNADSWIMYHDPGDYNMSTGLDTSNGAYVIGTATDLNNPLVTVKYGGNVGIGTSNPGYLLAMYGATPYIGMKNSASSDKRWSFGVADNDFRIDETGTANRLVILAGGNVGIGTTTPSTKTEINSIFSAGSAQSDFLRLTASQGGAWYSQTGLEFRWNDTGNSVAWNTARVMGGFDGWTGGSGTSGGQLEFYTKTDGTSYATNPSLKMILKNNGNVGIGTSTPGAKLSVVGTTAGGAIGTSFQQEIVNSNIGVGDWSGLIFRWIAGNANTNQAYIGSVVTTTGTETLSDLAFGTKASSLVTGITEYMRIKGGGNVGIGTTTPGAKLSVNGNIIIGNPIAVPSDLISGYIMAQFGKAGVISGHDNVIGGEMNYGYNVYRAAATMNRLGADGTSRITMTGAGISMYMGNSGAAGGSVTETLGLSINSAGNVGIGIAAPVDLLHVQGSVADYAAYIYQTGGASAAYGGLKVRTESTAVNSILVNNSGNDLFSIKGTGQTYFAGSMGIGTTSPNILSTPGTTMTLHGGSVYSSFELADGYGDSASALVGILHWAHPGNAASYKDLGSIGMWTDSSGTATKRGASMRFFTQPDNTAGAIERMRIQSDGYVGIGTTTPAAKLNVEMAATGWAALIKNPGVSGGSGLKVVAGNTTSDNVVYFTGNDGTASQTMVMLQNGNVGIGTTGPTSKFSVTGGIEVGGYAGSRDAGTGNIEIAGNYVFVGAGPHYIKNSSQADNIWQVWNGAATVDAITVLSNGNVGIGAASPAGKFNIANYSRTGARTYTNGLGEGLIVDTYYDDGASYLGSVDFVAGRSSDANNGGSQFRFFTQSRSSSAPTVTMLINKEGNVGIGTNNPIGKLDVVGDAGTNKFYKDISVSQTDYSYFYIKMFKLSTGSGWNSTTFNGKICANRSNDLGVSTCADVFVSRDYYSNVYFGETMTSGGNYGSFGLVKYNDGSQDWITLMIDAHGGAGIVNFTIDGTLYNANSADVVAMTGIASNVSLHSALTYTAKSVIISVGDLYTHDGGVHSASDLRLKNVIGSYTRGLVEILNLNPINFKYKEGNALGLDPNNPVVGLAAQEVSAYIPEAVKTNEMGYLTLTQGPIFYALVNAVKELNSKITVLETQNGLLNSDPTDKGITMNNVKAIVSINGMFSVDEQGKLIVQNLEAQKARLNKLEMVDQVTGQVWCTWIANGEWQKQNGECGLQNQNSNIKNQNEPTPEVVPDSTPVVEPAPEVVPEPTPTSEAPAVEPTPEVVPEPAITPEPAP